MEREVAAQHPMGFRVLVSHPVIVPRADGLVTAMHRSTVLWISSPSSEKGRSVCQQPAMVTTVELPRHMPETRDRHRWRASSLHTTSLAASWRTPVRFLELRKRHPSKVCRARTELMGCSHSVSSRRSSSSRCATVIDGSGALAQITMER